MKFVRGLLVAASASALFGAPAFARPFEVERSVPSAQQVGEARYHVLAWAIFDASLYAEGGSFAWERPFALTLTYRRSFSAQALASRTLVEMQRRGYGGAAELAPLGRRLQACFADVAPGDRITGVSMGPNSARFYFNGAQRCEIEWPGFRRAFFGIWLDAQGEARTLSGRLRGGE
jgi:hypothetical protein